MTLTDNTVNFRQPLLLSCLLTAGVYLAYTRIPQLIAFLMLFLPFIDAHWKCTDIKYTTSALLQWTVPGLLIIILLWMDRSYTAIFLNMLLLTALPEEWFFRGYLQKQLGNSFKANFAATVLFSLLHLITRGPVVALLVALPSLAFGYVYSRQKDIVLVVLLHAVSNMIYIIYLEHSVVAIFS